MIPMVGAFALNSASQILSSLFSALDPSSASGSASSAASGNFDDAVSASGSNGSNALTGSSTGQLSGQILMTLMAMQQQSGSASSSSAATGSSASSDPVQQLFSAMDSNGDGSVSQTEMESYVENAGGTQADADALYGSLSQSGTAQASAASATTASAGISEAQMQSAVSQAQSSMMSGAHGHHRHHHGMGGSGGQADSVANTLLQAMDTNDDGSVNESEFTSFVTANGGTAADAQSDFAALNTSGSGSLTSADFAKAWESMQSQTPSQSAGSLMVSMLDAFAKSSATSATTATTSVSA